MSGYVWKKNCTFVFFLQEWIYITSKGLPKVFMIHHAKDDAEPAIRTIMTPPVKSADNMFCVIQSMLPLSLNTKISHMWEYTARTFFQASLILAADRQDNTE